MNFKAIIFDFDGTLVKLGLDFPLMRASVLDLLLSYGVAPDGLDGLYVLEMIEAGRKMIEEASPGEGDRFFQKAYEAIRQIEVAGARRGELVTGVRDMLSSLKERGIAVGIATRNCRDAVLESFPDIQSFCDTLVTRESTRRVKPDPEQILIALRALHVDASLSAMVGDHPMDIEAGRRAGSFTVGVLTGYSSADALTAAGANLIIERATHITRYLRTKKKG
ncbi:MAG: HAD family hydrolase [Syntrophobacterales bacterium]|nr:HAD family hydrolase [Syntrophobacterales bacterium]HRT27626.1 HAD family hydrolase [Syntrophales bacterium]